MRGQRRCTRELVRGRTQGEDIRAVEPDEIAGKAQVRPRQVRNPGRSERPAAHRVLRRRFRLHGIILTVSSVPSSLPVIGAAANRTLDPNLAAQQLRREVTRVALLGGDRRSRRIIRAEALVTHAVHGRGAAPVPEFVHAALDQDVLRLDVQVRHVSRVRARQRRRHLSKQRRDLRLAELGVARASLRRHVIRVVPRRP